MNLITILFSLLFFVSWGIAIYSVSQRWQLIKSGLKENVPASTGFRIKQVLVNVLLQKKLMQNPLRGIFHVFIFYGFLVYSLHSLSQFIGGFLGDPYFYIPEYFPHWLSLLYAYFLDSFSFLVLAGLLFFVLRRYVWKAKELDRPSTQSIVVVTMISFLMIFSLIGETANYIYFGHDKTIFRQALAPVINVVRGDIDIKNVYLFGWWGHLIALFAFLIYVPSSKHAHLIWAPINYWFKPEKSVGQMRYMDVENSSVWGAGSIHQFSWKNLLDSFACIECGRCELACPAARTGKPLSPKKIMSDLKHDVLDKMPLVQKEYKSGKSADDVYADEALSGETRVIGKSVLEAELWACTTCYACVQECPVGNHQADSILEMRRSLVLNEGSMPSELAGAMTNMENQGNPWGIGADTRADWAQGQDIKIMSELPEQERPELLFWVGCAGSFEDRNKKVSLAFSRLLKKAGVDFAILGTEETCSGDSARRGGNEYLYQSLAAQNVEVINGYGVKKIVTACPHCYNTLKNEYPDFGGKYEVMHHSELLQQLVNENKLKLKEGEKQSVVYHDSCYLGRYNDIFEQPRFLLAKKETHEAAEHHSKSMCCGAGGAQMWMEEEGSQRVNAVRAKQLLDTKADVVASACPFCMIMLRDGMQAVAQDAGVDLKTQSLDIAEILEQSVE